WRCLLLGRAGADSRAANLALRLIQVHVAILLLVSGLHKLQSGAWWSGVAHWYLLHPPLTTRPADLGGLASGAQGYLVFLNLAAYGTLAWQLAFPLFA